MCGGGGGGGEVGKMDLFFLCRVYIVSGHVWQ